MPPDTAVVLDAAIADLFSLDRRVEPAEDLTGYPCSGGCTDNGCSRPSTCLQDTRGPPVPAMEKLVPRKAASPDMSAGGP